MLAEVDGRLAAARTTEADGVVGWVALNAAPLAVTLPSPSLCWVRRDRVGPLEVRRHNDVEQLGERAERRASIK